MDNKNKAGNNINSEIKKDQKSSKNSLVKEFLHDEFEDTSDETASDQGRNHTNEEDHHQKRVTGVKKGFCNQDKCDIYFE